MLHHTREKQAKTLFQKIEGQYVFLDNHGISENEAIDILNTIVGMSREGTLRVFGKWKDYSTSQSTRKTTYCDRNQSV